MTAEDKDALIGRLYQEKKQLEEDVRLIWARAKEIGSELTTLGYALQERPLEVVFENQEASTVFVSRTSKVFTMKGASLDGLKELTTDLREKTARLEQVKKDLG
ncbi:hypothetical protein [Tunturiibacter gelidoferens]|uniref:Uncharacterized protein n=1 Tax=Tunturiibacter gelidiferens TaxID=3069689 RepID=A0ACC5P216_9BACT|nr:hypothetical protein [Edaphobacter lichenicola]MBB5340825.1 hypothetical protein [Edaphobacter lichenicola]